ncbi:MAG: DUF5329 domain-containing protein [Bacteroidia bacterium]|nr:DUF5329 domain-containing protein [Bacteroidia bacterium]
MKHTFIFIFTLLLGSKIVFAGASIGGPLLIPQSLTEEQKITHLIIFVEKMDACFIRNGEEYNPVDAAKHLRMKREKAGKQIKTAKDFIDNVASKSSMSGVPYQIKYPNGVKLNARDVLYNELKKVEAKHAGNYHGIRFANTPVC